jgi:hypothetical protein
VTYRAAPLGLLLAVLLFSCGGEASPLAWTIQFDIPADRTSTAVVATRVLEGGCSGTTVYTGNIVLPGGGGAPQPDELGSGLHGFSVQALGSDCTIIDSVCDEYDLPLDQATIVSVLTGAGAGGSSCGPGTMCIAGTCTPIPRPDGGDTGVPCEGEGAACEGGAGVCHALACCLGCWDGTRCELGTTASACGMTGGACMTCDPGDTCQAATCVVTNMAPSFSMSQKAVFYRHSDGSYWANGDDGTFMQLGPVAAPSMNLRGYTGSLRFADIGLAEVASAGVELGTGALYTWGSPGGGALGNGSSTGTPVTEPTQIATIDTFRESAGGGSYFCAIHTNGTMWCWGSNTSGQLGTGTVLAQNRPTQINDWRWISVTAFFEHTCAIRDDRALFCWGNGEDGRLGNGDGNNQSSPVRVGTGNDWVDVSAGMAHTCGVRDTAGNRRLYCWGRATSGVLGMGDDMSPVMVPQEVRPDLTTWQQVAAGDFHTCALVDIGGEVQAFCWGFGAFGALGTGVLDRATTPVPVDFSPNDGWTTITAGVARTCGISAGTAYCWGDGTAGWLGVGLSEVVPSPTPVVFDPVLP